MPVHEVTIVLCDQIKREPGNNKATLEGLFDRVAVTGFPAGLNANLFIRFFGAGSSTQVELTLVLNRPNGAKELLPAFVFACVNGKVEGEINLQGLPLFGKGRHSFSLTMAGTAIGSASFNVDVVEVKNVDTAIQN